MSWGSGYSKNDTLKGMRPMPSMILGHKQRYHQDYNQNYDSDKIHQVLGKHWYNLNADARNQAMGGTQRSATNQFQFIKDNLGELDSNRENKDQQKQQQNKNQKKNLNSTQTSYGVQTYVAERFMDANRKALQKEKQEHDKKKNNVMEQRQAYLKNQQSRKLVVKKNNFLANENNRYQSQNSTFNQTQSTMESPRKLNSHYRQKSMVNTVYTDNGRPTTEKRPGYSTDKTCYKDLTLQNQSQQQFYSGNQQSKSVSLGATGMSVKSVQARGNANPFRMSTYDAVFGSPSKKYPGQDDSDEEEQVSGQKFDYEHQVQKRLKQYDESAKNMSLFSYKGCIPKNMNLTYKWQSHQYERDNFMRQPPIWTNSGSSGFEGNQTYKRRQMMSQGNKRFQEYKKYY